VVIIIIQTDLPHGQHIRAGQQTVQFSSAAWSASWASWGWIPAVARMRGIRRLAGVASAQLQRLLHGIRPIADADGQTVRTPCCHARCSSSSRSASYRGLSRCACESTSHYSFRVFPSLFEPRAYFDIFQKAGQDGLAFSPTEAATIIPFDSRPRNFLGCRLATITTLRPMSFSGS
jgi:hypothetical protein